jgi:hypothetical protein
MMNNSMRSLWARGAGFKLNCRGFVQIGDAVPINYIKDGTPPIIKEDKEYPPWVLKLTERLPNKKELLRKLEMTPDLMDRYELRRAKRLIGLDEIRATSALKAEGTD